jgi:diguanylate cyclase (GGDEF)-like protein/PAS domain S-box-containing protein
MPESARPQADVGTRPDDEFGIGELFGVVPDAVVVGDAATGRVVRWNPAAAAMFGFAPGEGPGLLIEDLVPDSMRAAHRAGMERLAHGEPTPLIDSETIVELPARRKDGTELWIELRLAHITGPDEGRFALAVIRDISIRREAEAAREAVLQEMDALRLQLEQRNRELDVVSRTDHLTRLWNRRHVEEHLTMALSASRRHERPVAVLLLDIDEFKAVNDGHGHQAGDRVLREIAARLRTAVRGEDTLGRWGGDEFLVVLPDTTTEAAIVAAERLRAAVAATPLEVAGAEVSVTISVGVAVAVSGDEDGLLTDADAALARAKQGGRNRCAT